MMKTYRYMALGVIAIALAACAQNDDLAPDQSDEVVRIASAHIATEADTRVNSLGDADAFESGDQILLVNTSREAKNSGTYRYNDGSWNTSDIVLYASGTSSFKAYYPAAENFTLPADQSTEQLLRSADRMTAAADAAKGAPVALEFKHENALVVLNTTFATEYKDKSMDDIEQLTIGGITPYRPTADADGLSTASYYAILAPGTGFTVDLTMDGTSRSSATAVSLEAGMRYDFNFIVGKAEVTIGDVSVNDWHTGSIGEATACATMKFTVSVNGSNLTYNIPFPTSGTTPAKMIVNWGDGRSTTVPAGTALSDTDAFSNHAYPAAGTYQITIASFQLDYTQQQIPEIHFYNNRPNYSSNRTKLKSLDTPLLNTGQTSFARCFYNLQNLTGTIPEGFFANNPKATTFYECFSQCSNLTGTIPEDLFANNPAATDFSYCFYYCQNLTGTIPGDLFKYNPAATDFRYCFYYCQNLTGTIPEDLFKYNPAAETFSNCFNRCTGLSGEIPANLFVNNKEAKIFSNCFGSLINLTEIPKDLFVQNKEATGFGACFSNCTNLTSIPEGLFDNNPNVTDFGNCFRDCTSLTEIPKGLFDIHSAAEYFNGCFSDCTGLTEIPKGLFDNNPDVTNFSGCFRGCTGLTEIPKGLFDNNPDVTNFSGCFSGCTGLTEIPIGLFDIHSAAENFSYCFSDCTGLEGEIPEGLFAKNTLVTNFSYCFRGCTGLTGKIPATLFSQNTLVTDFSYCFRGCTGLEGEIPEGLFAKNTLVTNFSYCFYNCTKLKMNKYIFIEPGEADYDTKIKTRFSLIVVYPNKYNFDRCFQNCGSATDSSVAPELWNYKYGNYIDGGDTGDYRTLSTVYCFRDCNASNYSAIKSSWRQ